MSFLLSTGRVSQHAMGRGRVSQHAMGQGAVCPGGSVRGCLLGERSARGVCPGGLSAKGVYLPREVYLPRGVCPGGVCLGRCLPRGYGRPPLPREAATEVGRMHPTGMHSYFYNFLEDISPLCGTTDTPVLDFW